MAIDFGQVADDYRAYRVRFVPELLERLRQFEIGAPGQKVLDLGAGTGLFASALAAAGSHVVQADLSAELLKESPLSGAIVASANALPFADESFDVVTAAQCWHWFNRQHAPREIVRVLRPGGALAVVYQTYIPLPGSVAEATERLILKHRPGWRHTNSTGINGQVLRDVQIAGFVGIESFSFDVEFEFTHEAWRGYIRTTSPIGGSMDPGAMRKFDLEHAAMLEPWPDMLRIPHRVFTAVVRKRG